MNTRPVLSFSAIAGLLAALWVVVIANGLLDGLSDAGRDSITALVALAIPIVAGILAERLTTALKSPNLPIGTEVNVNTDDATGVVVEKAGE